MNTDRTNGYEMVSPAKWGLYLGALLIGYGLVMLVAKVLG